MRQFKDFGIKAEKQGFIGNKIKVNRILNKLIVVHDFKIEDSKQFKGKCLHLQIESDGVKSVIFTGSTGLIDMIQKVPRTELPFQTTIIEDNDRFEFS